MESCTSAAAPAAATGDARLIQASVRNVLVVLVVGVVVVVGGLSVVVVVVVGGGGVGLWGCVARAWMVTVLGGAVMV